jgi:acetoacetyl-CoA synthetase
LGYTGTYKTSLCDAGRTLTCCKQTTVNLKKVELPVKQIVSGKVIKASGTLANPESLSFYEQFARVEQVLERNSKGGMKSKL